MMLGRYLVHSLKMRLTIVAEEERCEACSQHFVSLTVAVVDAF